MFGRGGGDKISGSRVEIPTTVKVSFLRYVKKAMKRHRQRARKTLHKLQELRELECLHNSDCDVIKQSERADSFEITGEPLCSSGCDPVTTGAHATMLHEPDQVSPQKPFRFSDFIGNKETESQGTGLAETLLICPSRRASLSA